MIIIKVENNTMTITRGAERRSSADIPPASSEDDVQTAENAPKKASGDGGNPGPGGGDGGNPGPGGGDGGNPGPGGGRPGSMFIVGPIIMTGSGSRQPHSIPTNGIQNESGLGDSLAETKAAAIANAASVERNKNGRGSGDSKSTHFDGGGETGSVIVVGPIVIQDFAEDGVTRSGGQEDSAGTTQRPPQAAAATVK